MVEEHVQKMSSDAIVITPSHADRQESDDFRETKDRLRKDGRYYCYICNSKDKLQVHHYGCEWSLSSLCDFDKLKDFCLEWDVYGYSKLMQNIPFTSVDDIRNMMVLCQEHHTGINNEIENPTGVHNLVLPYWIMQKISLQGKNPVPQEGETIQEAKDRI